MALHYISSSGSASWVNSTNISTPCSLSTANANILAGDIGYLRGGAYSITSVAAIAPTHDGTLTSRIIYQAYPGETPYFVSTGGVNDYDPAYGIAIQNHGYITVDGPVFEDFFFWIALYGANHCEVKNSEFYNTVPGADNAQTVYIGNYGGGTHSTHNWIHLNKFHYAGGVLPEEGCDMIKIGSGAGGWNDLHSNNNTIEDNDIYWAGHTCTEDYCELNVWRKNRIHNEGWKSSSGYAVYGTATGGSSSTLIDTSKNFTALGVTTGWKICSLSQYEPDAAVTSISTTTNPNDTLHFSSGLTFSSGIGYVIVNMHGAPANSYGPSPPGTVQNGKFSHRCMSITGMPGGTLNKKVLIEGNRVGFAGTNCNNNGADGMTLGGPGALVRFNDIFGCDGPGINWKGYGTQSEASYDGTYVNNTMFKNGQAVVGNINPPIRSAFHFYNGYSTNNRVKNSILWQNGPSPYSYGQGGGADQTHQTWANNAGDHTDASFGCVNYGNPLFVDTGLTDPSSPTVPDLHLQAGSPLIGQGGPLTTANGSGSGSVTLVVADARYFQDGTWGSDLPRGVTFFPDWIAVGTVSRVAQISSINYSTNTITLDTPMTWSSGDSVWLYKNSSGERVLYGAAPDIGAHAYTSGSPGGVVLVMQTASHAHLATQIVLGTGGTGSFSLSAFPSSRTIAERNTTTFTILAVSSGGFSGNIILVVSDVPTGCTAFFDVNPIGPNGTSILTIDTTNMSVPPGNYTITVSGIEA